MVAAVAFNAKDLTRIVEAARLGMTEIELNIEGQPEDIAFAATLPAHALRNLFKHFEVHLNVEWRDLTTLQWTFHIGVSKADRVEVSQTPCCRTVFIWDHSILLSAGGSANLSPPGLAQVKPSNAREHLAFAKHGRRPP